jgi:hypothetical protein
MADERESGDAAERFVQKLNGFLHSLDEQEQGWLVALLGAASQPDDAQGYILLPAPFTLGLAEQTIGSATGGAGGRVTTTDFRITKQVDASSPGIFRSS